MADTLNEILRAASKHPNSRVSKLIHTVEGEPNQKNIVLLLIELAEHAEYSTDFNVSLKYYLDLFERLGINSDLVLNEAGLLLVNSSKIYSKRVDYVQSLVERQILTLSNADEELQRQKLEQQQAENATPAEKPKRGRKRALEVPSDPYEIELTPKKFKKLTEEKRFASSKSAPKAKSIQRNIEMEQHIHPAGWLHATIYDLENEEDVDTKRNYKLFTYHVEHRYNTLVPDINFRLHFKVKDYMDEQEEMEEDEACNTDRSWPPLSEAYVQKYLRLENYVLQQDQTADKRKAAELDEDWQETEKSPVKAMNNSIDCIENLNSSNINDSGLLNSTANNSANDVDNLDSTNLNGNNDSGLGQSILDETNNTLDSTNSENLNNSNVTDNNKSLNVTDNQPENDSALGTSVLDQTDSTENNTTTDSETLNQTNVETETNKSLNASETQLENDSALGTSVLDQTSNTENNTTIESMNTTTNSENLNETNAAENNISLNVTETQLENDSALDTTVLDPTNNADTTQKGLCETTTIAEISGLLETSTTENITTTKANESNETSTKESEEANKDNAGKLIKVTENRKDSALSDDRHHSISTENLAMSTENVNKPDELSGKTLQIDVAPQEDKDNNQIHVQLPHTDDEGVYLSDLEEQDCRMLSPVIKATNILPGVQRKDVTIYMDDELREALDMRDGIMKHFSHETYKVPVIREPKKENLLFNIFKLPDKLVRRKIIFKLGPEMDLYLQARSLKRPRPEAPPRVKRTPQLLQWFSLNNTDMTDVCMSPPYSPGHCSDFCGFSDNEDDENNDTVSCAEFCGFTEEEQATLTVQQISRLSRDSGVGVDVNNLTPEKEQLEIIFEEGETSSAADNCKRILNLDQTADNCEQSTESILNKLPPEIREVLTTELQGNSTNPAREDSEKLQTENSESLSTENTSKNNTQKSSEALTENSTETQTCTEASGVSTEPLANTQESNVALTENATETATCTEESTENKETLATTQESNVALTENSTETQMHQPQSTEKSAVSTKPLATDESQDKASENEIPKNANAEMSGDKPSNLKECNKSAVEILKEKIDLANSMDQSSNFEDHHAAMEDDDDCDSDDDVMLDLDTQGIKTKIQQWHEHLQPILAKSRERHHFDVFKLGTEIIDTVKSKHNDESSNEFEPPSSRPIASFQDIMDSKDNSYVSRYFLSTLLLANQSNIEISIDNKSSEKPSAWQDIHLRLLSTKRHTVAIEDNIGMIGGNKQKASDKSLKTNAKEKQNKTALVEEGELEDEPLIKLQNIKKSPKKTKTSLKRHSDNETPTFIAEKKPKEITTTTTTTTTNSRRNELPNLIESVQIITPSPLVNTPAAAGNINVMPSTSRQAPNLNTALFNVDMNTVRTLQPIEKVQKRSDDYDSGIFSIGEMSTS